MADSRIPDALKAIAKAVDGVAAFEADGFCACEFRKPCYLHGVAIPEAVAAAAAVAQELRRKAFPESRSTTTKGRPMRDHERLVRDLLQRGLDVAHGGKHLKVTDGEQTVAVALSPSDWRGRKNLVAQLRRVGFVDPPAASGAPKRGRRPEATVEPYEGARTPYGRPWRGRTRG